MDDLVDKLIDSFEGYIKAKKELQECYDGCEYDAGYFCQQEQQYVDEYKQDIKDALIGIVGAAK